MYPSPQTPFPFRLPHNIELKSLCYTVGPYVDSKLPNYPLNDAKAETPVLWPPHAKSRLIGKDFDVGRDWGQEEKGTTEAEMAGWHH